MIPEITREQKVPNNNNPQEKEHTQKKKESV